MADYTAKLGLKKPADTDYVDIADINGNMDTLDEAFARYAVCSTAAATAAKTVTIPGFKLFAGAVVYIKFDVTNTAPYPTLDVNSTGAAQIYYRGGAIVAGTLAANRTYAFVYNGTQYELIGDINTDTQYSAGTGLTKSGNTFNHANYGSADTAGPEANDSPGYGGTIPVPQVTTNAQGHVTALTERSITLPAAPTSVSGNAGTATKLATARTIDGVSFNGSAAITHYGTCSTAAGTAAKTVACAGFVKVTGARICVKFAVTNTASSPTLNVNSTGAAPIYYRGSAINPGFLGKDCVYQFIFLADHYELVGDINTNTTYSAFTGATATAAGKAGLVPAPAAGYNNRFLRGDGTWAEAGGMDLDALASNTDPIVIQGEGANNATSLTLRQKNASYDNMIQTLEMKSFYGPPGSVYRTYLKQGSDPTGTEGTDYIGFEWYSNYNHMSGHFRPLRDSAYTLGDSTTKWSVVYATNGTIQTSDRRRKSDIRLVPQKDQTAEETPALTQEDLLDFVRNVDIYTYVSDPEHTKTVQDAMSANEYEKIHIGIMANDLTGSKIFPFVGHKDGADENAPVGMKYESLGVVALYAIRALYDRIDKLEKRIEELEAERR